ncbi:hypothetical protein [Jannaschia pohangensis]|uniref:Phenylalanyl-tRNA synthetase subunit beta n=1 Tax=Jannaschia pohangensis TaxID=390807 RepID=A0A1I3S8F5_9RHOB|nr:hypothetical protein [Jannaschia pohangensis]SFJ54985.1 hypothetical protein SAMN04488095_3057 [Jannaschia pohangensis]
MTTGLSRRLLAIVAVLICGIVVAHVFLWRSDMATSAKLAFTVLNAVSWTIIIAPVFLVDKWLASVRSRSRQEPRDDKASE